VFRKRSIASARSEAQKYPRSPHDVNAAIGEEASGD